MLALVQQYLLNHSLADLEIVHHVNGRTGSYKFSLNYDQILSDDHDTLAMECRGLVLARKDGTVVRTEHEIVGETIVLAFPMRRFFNLGQSAAAKIDFSAEDVRYYEKEDGTLIIVYFDSFKDEWCVATRSVCEANLPIDRSPDLTFRTLFEQAVQKSTSLSFPEWTNLLVKGWTYCFELTTPLNQVVVAHYDFKVHLLTVRDLDSGQEAPNHKLEMIAKSLGVLLPVSYNFQSIDEMLAFVNARLGSEFEGLVVCDSNHNRVKIKSEAYLNASRIVSKMGATDRNILEVVLMGQADDIYPILPKYHQERLVMMQENVRSLADYYNHKFFELNGSLDSVYGTPEHRKQFAVTCNQLGLRMGTIMGMYVQGQHPDFIGSLKQKSGGGFTVSILDVILEDIDKIVTKKV